jgi:hypothetical protein
MSFCIMEQKSLFPKYSYWLFGLLGLYLINKSVVPDMVTETKRSPDVVCTLSSFRDDRVQFLLMRQEYCLYLLNECVSLLAYCERGTV